MADVQGTYVENLRPAVAGQPATMIEGTRISRTVENASGVLFGQPVAQGVADKGAIRSTTGVTKILGAAVRDRSSPGVLENGYAQKETMSVMTEGDMWVVASVAVVPGDIVHVIVATAAWAKTGGVLVPNARWETTAGIGELGVIRFGGPAS